VPVLNPVPVVHNDNPANAGDEDVIEKEWVDKAKKIVTQTKDDPYKQEQEVSKLQADYLKKRYGKDVKLASD
jgi:Txe/YoeB family toxin of Txe-Axe toxin-antitoxin module